MGPDFVQEVAPELALRGRFTESQAGLAGPEYMYDSRGNPLNWIQNEGGVRQFYVPEGEQAYAEPWVADEEINVPFPSQAPQAGLAMPGSTRFSSDRAYQSTPTPSSTPRFNMGTSAGNLPRANATIPPAPVRPTAPSVGNSQRFQTMNGPIQNAPADMLRMAQGNTRPQRVGDQPDPGRYSDLRTENRSPNISGLNLPQNATLADMLSRLNIRLPNIRLPDAGTGEARAATGLRGRGAVDVEPTQNARALNNFDNRGLPRFDTPEMVADFNAVTGFNLRPVQARTRTRQLELQAAGQTEHDYSYHIPGPNGEVLAGDIPAADLGGRTGAAAEEHVRNILQEAGYPVNNMDIVWKSGHGRNQGTGPHVHIEPNATYRRR